MFIVVVIDILEFYIKNGEDRTLTSISFGKIFQFMYFQLLFDVYNLLKMRGILLNPGSDENRRFHSFSGTYTEEYIRELTSALSRTCCRKKGPNLRHKLWIYCRCRIQHVLKFVALLSFIAGVSSTRPSVGIVVGEQNKIFYLLHPLCCRVV